MTLTEFLRVADRDAPLARKRLLAPSVNFGREALHALLRACGGPCIGWEATTLRRLADELSFVARQQADIRTATDVELADLTAGALAAASPAAFGRLVSRPGFGRAVHDAVLELRMAGVTPAQVRVAAAHAPIGVGAADVLEAYEAALEAARLADPARVFRLALEHLPTELPLLHGDARLLAVGLGELPGLPAALLSALADALGERLSTWEPRALMPAQLAAVRVFRGAVPEDEVLAVLRHAAATGTPVAELEFAAEDRDGAGAAVHAVTARLGHDCSLLHGLPALASRLGRAAQRLLELLVAPDLAPALLAEGLERAELQVPGTPLEVSAAEGASLAAFVRRHRAGGEAARVAMLIEAYGRMQSEYAPPPAAADDEERAAERRRQFAAEAQRVRRLLAELVARRAALGARPAAPNLAAALAEAIVALVPALHDEGSARTRLLARLGQLAAAPVRADAGAHAVAEVRLLLERLRTWPTGSGWNSRGDAPHVTDLRHAGATGRRLRAFTGLAAEAVRGTQRESPLLDDLLRAQLQDAAGRPLPNAGQRARRRRRALEGAVAEALADGAEVVFSWPAGPHGESAPDRLVLQALRVQAGDATLAAEALVARARPASPLPEAGATLDQRDAWLHALLADGPRDGTAAVEAAHPALGRWAAQHRAWEADGTIDAARGLVPEAVDLLPTHRTTPASPTELEQLLACPRRWLYGKVLGLGAPTDGEDEAWPDARAYGTLLHRACAEAVTRAIPLTEAAALDQLARLSERLVAELAREVPPPLASAPAAAARRLARDLAVWRQWVLERPVPQHVQVEHTLRRALPLADGRQLPLAGRIDRLETHADGRLVLRDYKTGRPLDEKAGPAAWVQPWLYAQLVEAPDADTGFCYPTERRHGGEDRPMPAGMGPQVARALDGVLAIAETGAFPPTSDARACTWCDFAVQCRASGTRWSASSRPAAWAERAAKTEPGSVPAQLQAFRKGDA